MRTVSSVILQTLPMNVAHTALQKDIEPLKLWEPLLDLLSSPSDAIRANALGVIGTAIQNNPTAQLAVRACAHADHP
jgi:hsp70-interacting protein